MVLRYRGDDNCRVCGVIRGVAIAATFRHPTAINWRRYRGQFPRIRLKCSVIHPFFPNQPSFVSMNVRSDLSTFLKCVRCSNRSEWAKWRIRSNGLEKWKEQGGFSLLRWQPLFNVVLRRVTRLPNNQSLTRLVLPLGILRRHRPTSPTPTGPFSRAAKLWHVGFASILLNYLPAWPGVVLSLLVDW